MQYDLNILDKDGKQVYGKENLIAKGGTDTQNIDFPHNAKYTVQVTVNGLMKDGQQIDKTRNGVAMGTVIIPEFSSAILPIIVAGTVSAVLTATRRFSTAP